MNFLLLYAVDSVTYASVQPSQLGNPIKTPSPPSPLFDFIYSNGTYPTISTCHIFAILLI